MSREVLLPFLDGEVSRALVGAMERNGVKFCWKQEVRECHAGGAAGVTLRLASGMS